MTSQEIGIMIGTAIVTTITGTVGLLKAGSKNRLHSAISEVLNDPSGPLAVALERELKPVVMLLSRIREQMRLTVYEEPSTEDPDKTPRARPLSNKPR